MTYRENFTHVASQLLNKVIDHYQTPIATGKGWEFLAQHLRGWKHVDPLVDDRTRWWRSLLLLLSQCITAATSPLLGRIVNLVRLTGRSFWLAAFRLEVIFLHFGKYWLPLGVKINNIVWHFGKHVRAWLEQVSDMHRLPASRRPGTNVGKRCLESYVHLAVQLSTLASFTGMRNNLTMSVKTTWWTDQKNILRVAGGGTRTHNAFSRNGS